MTRSILFEQIRLKGSLYTSTVIQHLKAIFLHFGVKYLNIFSEYEFNSWELSLKLPQNIQIRTSNKLQNCNIFYFSHLMQQQSYYGFLKFKGSVAYVFFSACVKLRFFFFFFGGCWETQDLFHYVKTSSSNSQIFQYVKRSSSNISLCQEEFLKYCSKFNFGSSRRSLSSWSRVGLTSHEWHAHTPS